MFHLLVKYDGWAPDKDSMPEGRLFEYTSDSTIERFKPGGKIDTSLLTIPPALFLSETSGTGDQIAKVGGIDRIEIVNKSVMIEYSLYEGIPEIPNSSLEGLSAALNISSWEFTRTHWAIKDADLLKIILGAQRGVPVSPKVFTLEAVSVDPTLLSVMMPFGSKFDEVFGVIKTVARGMNLHCLRADDMWKHDAIIQDVVSLINKSSIVVCDCTDRNANVFYEAGIAHTLGRPVILITQSESDIPFDLRHLRHIVYLNDKAGVERLADRLEQRIQTLISSVG